MKKLIGIFALITVFVVAVFMVAWTPPPPSFSNLAIQGYSIDTLTNTAADTLVFNYTFDYPSQLTFTLNNIELSGTSTTLWRVEQSAFSSGTANWVMTDTLGVITATGATSITLTAEPQRDEDRLLYGYRARLIGTNSGTGAHRYNVNAIARRLNK